MASIHPHREGKGTRIIAIGESLRNLQVVEGDVRLEVFYKSFLEYLDFIEREAKTTKYRRLRVIIP
jgi:hypothetical protein